MQPASFCELKKKSRQSQHCFEKEIRKIMAQELYSLRQAAAIIGCSQASVQRTYRRAKIKGIKAGGAILVSMTQIENMRKHYDDKHANARPKNG